MHYSTFDRESGRREFRDAVNEDLRDYGSGYELNVTGEIVHTAERGFETLVAASLPHGDASNVRDRVEEAVTKYHSRNSTLTDRRDAVRHFVDVLEYLRPHAKQVLTTKDEADLFNIANNFGVRHHNAQQHTDYDLNIWTRWMFYYYLATIHAAVRLTERKTA